MSAKTFAAFIAVLAVLGLLGYGLVSEGKASLETGDPAPLASDRLERLDGEGTGSIADHRGDWVLVNFWASWCEPCRDEAPALEQLHRNGGDRFTVLGIDLDDASADARDFVREFTLTYPQLRVGDGDEHRDAWGMTGFPESFLVDPDGNVALIRRGPVTREYLDRNVRPLIAGGAGTAR